MPRFVLGLLVLGACAAQPESLSLAELETAYEGLTVEVVARDGQVNVQLLVAPSTQCPLLDDVSATFNGQRMHVSRGGYDQTAHGCYPIAFWFDSTPPAVINWERSSSGSMPGSELRLEDASARWSVATSRLFGEGFALDAAASRIVWNDVEEIATARISPAVPFDIVGNAIEFLPGTDITWVNARAHPRTRLCDGPALCTVDLESAHDFTLAP